MLRRTLVLPALWVVLASTCALTQAQPTYPSKPIRCIVPYAPGGSTDVLARLIGPRLTEVFGQPVVVDNRAGGNTIIGTDLVAKAPADGYTVLAMAIAHAIIPNLLAVPYDPIRDFAPVATLASGELMLVLHPAVPASTLNELIALARARPGQLNYASASTGGPLHLAGELFNLMTGTKTQHVPYKGSGPALIDLIGGQVQMMFSPVDSALPHVRSGRLKALAITGTTRSSVVPNVATFAEAGLAEFSARNWFGVLAPARTPSAIIERLSAEIGRILATAEVRQRLVPQGLDPFISTPAQFAELIRADHARYGKVIKTANIRLEN